jgi:hypothetical protein
MEIALRARLKKLKRQLRHVSPGLLYDGGSTEVIVCIDCGVVALSEDLILNKNRCWACGGRKIEKRKAVWKSSGVLYKPNTWGTGRWEFLH